MMSKGKINLEKTKIKYRIMKKLMIIPAVVIMAFFSSCSDDAEQNADLTNTFDLDTETTIESNYEDVDDIVNAGVELEAANGRVEADELLDGAIITHDKDNNIITIDYGIGVEGPNGRVRKGKIIITYDGLRWEQGSFREVTFEEFYIDDVQVEGVRRMENTSTSTEDNPEFTVTLTGGKLTFTDNTTATREVNKVRTWLRAATRVNDEVSVEGTASGSRRDGTSYNVEIIEPIIYKRDCRRARVFVPVAGIKQITSGENVVTLNYGDGECDNIATLTINDEDPKEITLQLKGRRN